MVEENEKSVMDMAKELSDVSRNTGKITFKICYTATGGNIDVHKRFQKFCFENTNNEYLAGIGKLLDYAGFASYMMQLESRIEALEKVMLDTNTPVKEVEKVEDVSDDVKTF